MTTPIMMARPDHAPAGRIVDVDIYNLPGSNDNVRCHGVASNMRTAIEDVDLDGTTVRAGEHVMLVSCLHGLDPREYDRPLVCDFERAPKPPATFGAGAHRCPGASLARMEMRIMVELWLRHIPDFEIDPDQIVVERSGGVNGIMNLPLRWPAP